MHANQQVIEMAILFFLIKGTIKYHLFCAKTVCRYQK